MAQCNTTVVSNSTSSVVSGISINPNDCVSGSYMIGTSGITIDYDNVIAKGLESITNTINSLMDDHSTAKSEENRKENEGMVVSVETKNMLFRDDKTGRLSVMGCANGKALRNFANIMPDYAGIRVYNDDKGNPRAVYLDFVDGTTACAAAREGDPFDIERGLSVCIIKRLLDDITNGSGSSVYNKLVRRAIKLYERQLKDEKRRAEIEAANEAKAQKLAEKKRKRDECKQQKAADEYNAAKEEVIEMMKESWLRAMRECNGSLARAD